MNILADILAAARLGEATAGAGDAHGALLSIRADTRQVLDLYMGLRSDLTTVAVAWGLRDLNPYTMRRCLAENVRYC